MNSDGVITFDEFFKTIANMYNEEDRFIKPGKSADMSPVKMTKELDIAVQAATKVKAPELKLSDKAGSANTVWMIERDEPRSIGLWNHDGNVRQLEHRIVNWTVTDRHRGE